MAHRQDRPPGLHRWLVLALAVVLFCGLGRDRAVAAESVSSTPRHVAGQHTLHCNCGTKCRQASCCCGPREARVQPSSSLVGILSDPAEFRPVPGLRPLRRPGAARRTLARSHRSARWPRLLRAAYPRPPARVGSFPFPLMASSRPDDPLASKSPRNASPSPDHSPGISDAFGALSARARLVPMSQVNCAFQECATIPFLRGLRVDGVSSLSVPRVSSPCIAAAASR